MYAVFVCSIGIISVLLFTLVILCQSLLSKRRSTGEPNAIPDDCKALAKKGDSRRGEENAEKAGKINIVLVVVLNKIGRKKKNLLAKLEQRHFLPFK